MPWFVASADVESGEKVFVTRGNCDITPLINGETAFGALEDAIQAATTSIDYITWGFDPSMRFKSGGESIGVILLKKAKANKDFKIRVLVWYAGYYYSVVYGQADGGLTESGAVHTTANLPGYDKNPGESDKYVSSAQWYEQIKGVDNIEFLTRPLNNSDTSGAVEANANLGALDYAQEQAMQKAATHHQKLVLIDYPKPDKAVAFVMGSNTLPRYWDTDDHLLHHDNRRMDYVEKQLVAKHTLKPNEYKMLPKSVYFAPWQDISAKVLGSIQFDLQVNFARAWNRAGGGPLERERAKRKAKDYAIGKGVPALVLRTQPQEGKVHSISDAYFQNVKNAREFIYFENQYFRLPQLVSNMAAAADALIKAGRKERLRVFVVTNVPDGHARLNTYRMLRALGRSEQMPLMVKDTAVNKDSPEALPATQGGDEAGLQSVICTLSTHGGSDGAWQYLPIYTHSKLMIIDDNYYTLGSANVNARSFSTDTELNLGVADSSGGAKHLRTRLWWRHRRVDLESTMESEFIEWKKKSAANFSRLEGNSEPLVGHLIKFWDEGPVVRRADD
jgi:phosphatidylserine/phosphatidylglycerophosphate/cardiolipin synthase-like enzyme